MKTQHCEEGPCPAWFLTVRKGPVRLGFEDLPVAGLVGGRGWTLGHVARPWPDFKLSHGGSGGGSRELQVLSPVAN